MDEQGTRRWKTKKQLLSIDTLAEERREAEERYSANLLCLPEPGVGRGLRGVLRHVPSMWLSAPC